MDGRYQLLELLGQGGMGMVYAALDRLTRQTVALKRVLIDPARLNMNARSGGIDPRLARSCAPDPQPHPSPTPQNATDFAARSRSDP